MLEQLQRRFEIEGVRGLATRLVNSCLLSKHIKGGEIVYRTSGRWLCSGAQ